MYHVTVIVFSFLCLGAYARPQANIALVTTIAPSSVQIDSLNKEEKKNIKNEIDEKQPPPVITKVHVRADVQYRYAKTVVETYRTHNSNIWTFNYSQYSFA